MLFGASISRTVILLRTAPVVPLPRMRHFFPCRFQGRNQRLVKSSRRRGPSACTDVAPCERAAQLGGVRLLVEAAMRGDTALLLLPLCILCMCMYMYMYVHVCIHVYIYIYIHIFIYLFIYVCFFVLSTPACFFMMQ